MTNEEKIALQRSAKVVIVAGLLGILLSKKYKHYKIKKILANHDREMARILKARLIVQRDILEGKYEGNDWMPRMYNDFEFYKIVDD